jgi:phosphomannomutase
MTLIKSISGIRGTIGGIPGEALTPLDIVKFSAAFVQFIQNHHPDKKLRIVVGRDARVSGMMVNDLVKGTLTGMGVDVFDVGLSTTPTVELSVPYLDAHAGIILTASHNPGQWNALKLLNEKGEFITAADGQYVLEQAEKESFQFAEVNNLGTVTEVAEMIEMHVDHVLSLDLVDVDAIRRAGFKVAVDAVHSTGGLAIPLLLKKLGVAQITELYCEPTGLFPHNPEPLPQHVTKLCETVKNQGADLGIVVDPDVDRLAFVDEKGNMFGEEYTLVAVADYVLSKTPGNTVSNMSSTRALRDVTIKHGGRHYASAVGEVNVVEKMKQQQAVIGGEGNGGVIYPASHYGRDALVGVALFLTCLAESGKKVSQVRAALPDYVISKNKLALTPDLDVDAILDAVKAKYASYPINTEDGVKIDMEKEWVHLRKSNTEPIIRIYSESDTKENADALAKKMMEDIKAVVK